MNKLLWALVGLLGLDLALIATYIVMGLIEMGPTIAVADLAPMVVGAGVLVALVSLTLTTRRGASEQFLKSAAELLERAYTTLAQLDDQGRPKNVRTNWLAAARFLRAAENLGARITEESHKLVFREEREYWRARRHDLIYPNPTGFPPDYYAEKPEHMFSYLDDERPPLSRASLAVLYRFVRWPTGFEDPIGDEPQFTEKEIEDMQAFGPRGLGNLLARVQELKAARNREV